MTLRSAICVSLVAALSFALACGGQPVTRGDLDRRLSELERPNLVLIVVDTLRADWTSPYGSSLPTTPELQRWADRGLLFERVRSESSWTKISMASLLTSLWPRTHVITEATDGLGEGAVTLAEVLRDAGYATWAVQTNGWLDQSFGFHQGFERYVFPAGRGAQRVPRPQPVTVLFMYCPPTRQTG